jgi:transcriptional/translational regulatory protein YebC/TACO1
MLKRVKCLVNWCDILRLKQRRLREFSQSPGLAAAIKKAKEENMPNDTIDRAIKKATTDNSAQMENITYEAYGPGGCALSN